MLRTRDDLRFTYAHIITLRTHFAKPAQNELNLVLEFSTNLVLNLVLASVLHALAAAASKHASKLRAGASSTVTLDIDIREKCLLYAQNRKYSTKTICFRILHNVSIKKKKCLYIYINIVT